MGIRPHTGGQESDGALGLKVGDMDIIESYEAFAAQACRVAKDLASI
jgi:hypothetical protein